MIKGIAITGLFLITLFACAQKTAKNPNHKKEYIMNVNTDTATFANGCFWCTEAIFQEVKGVEKVMSGYTDGHTKNPTYKEVCTGETGHAECLQIFYNPGIISFDELLEIF